MSGRQSKKMRQLFRRGVMVALRNKPWWLPKSLWQRVVLNIAYKK